jgi:hypothetical protein
MLTAQKSLKQKILNKLYSWRSVFSIFYASGLPPPSPYNNAFFIYSAKSTKNPNIQVILGHGNPAALGRKNRPLMCLSVLA